MQSCTWCIAGQRSGDSAGTWQQCSRLEWQISHRAGSGIGITRQATCLWHVTATLVNACEVTCLQSFGLLTVLVLACQRNSNLLIAVLAAGCVSSPHCMCRSQYSDSCPNLPTKRIVMQVTWWCGATANRRSRGGSACLRRLWMQPLLPLLPGGSLDGC